MSIKYKNLPDRSEAKTKSVKSVDKNNYNRKGWYMDYKINQLKKYGRNEKC